MVGEIFLPGARSLSQGEQRLSHGHLLVAWAGKTRARVLAEERGDISVQ